LTVITSIIITPFSVFSASFWLSFYAVSIIFLTLWRLENTLTQGSKLAKIIKSLVIIQISLTLLLMPVTAIFYQQISLAALFANIVAVPLMSLFSIPLCLFSVIALPFSDDIAKFFMSLTLLSLEVLWTWLTVLSEQHWAIVSLSAKQVYLFAVFSFIGFFGWFLSPSPSFLIDHCKEFIIGTLFKTSAGRRLLSLFFCVCTFAFFSPSSSPDFTDWQVNVLDVGQGLSVVIERNEKAILYDTGAAYPSGFNLVDSVVLPYFQHRNISQVDKVMISHSDNDHAGGLEILEAAVSIDEIFYNTDVANSYSFCLRGQSFQWQGLMFKQLWPKKAKGKENDDSCVVHISDGQFSVLLTGDISKKVEYQLSSQGLLSADVIVAPHHGSKTSSSDLFISKVAPSYAIFSAGYLNRWSMPNKDVVQRYHKNHIKTYSTATSGMVSVNVNAHDIHIQEYRQALWPYWFSN
jgi:competence protein ComEC